MLLISFGASVAGQEKHMRQFNGLSRRLSDSKQDLGSFIIWKNGSIVYEKYFHGADSGITLK